MTKLILDYSIDEFIAVTAWPADLIQLTKLL